MADSMLHFSVETWILIFCIAFAGITAILHTIAQQYGEERRMHDLKVRVAELRKIYAAHLAEVSGKSAEEIVTQFKEKPIGPAMKKAA